MTDRKTLQIRYPDKTVTAEVTTLTESFAIVQADGKFLKISIIDEVLPTVIGWQNCLRLQ